MLCLPNVAIRDSPHRKPAWHGVGSPKCGKEPALLAGRSAVVRCRPTRDPVSSAGLEPATTGGGGGADPDTRGGRARGACLGIRGLGVRPLPAAPPRAGSGRVAPGSERPPQPRRQSPLPSRRAGVAALLFGVGPVADIGRG